MRTRSGYLACTMLAGLARRVCLPLRARAALSLPLVLLASGCMFRRLGRDLERLQAMALLGGHVSRAEAGDAPIVVALYTESPFAVVDTFVLGGPGGYYFTVPPGRYRIAAFLDRDRDLVYDPATEPAAYYGAPGDVTVGSGEQVAGLDLRLPRRIGVPLPFAVSARDAGQRGTKDLPAIHLGEIVTLDDPRFSAESARLGLWEPVDFLFTVGAGFYFLEPFDAKKTPVLFVHGAGGHPGDWRYLVEHMDRRRFQPWFLFYPSGMAIDRTAGGVVRWLRVLAARQDFDRLIIVAHSIGGLVSRAVINRLVEDGDARKLVGFVSISTPWNGHAMAARGVKEAPVVMPMWRDVSPGSAFLRGLFDTPLPTGCAYHLLFGYNGRSRMLDEPNDGVVAVSSELALPAQRVATKLYGFDDDHTGILSDPEVAATLNAILATAVQ